MHRSSPALLALLVLGLPATAGAAGPASLPTVVRTLSAPHAVKRDCAAVRARSARGLALTRYRAPMSGYVTARLSAARGDWDLQVIDHATRRALAASQGFRSNEVVQTWVTAGQVLDFVGCRRSGRARTARLGVSLLDVKPPAAGAPVSVVRVHAPNQKLDALDAAGLDVTESRGVGWADVLVAGARQRAILTRSHLPFTTRNADLDAYALRSQRADARYAARVGVAGSPLPSGRTTYRTYEDVQADLKKLVDEHPDEVRPVVIGKTFQGRDIQGVEIARNVKADDGRPTYFLMGEHHAREWPSEEIAMEYATMLANGGGDPRLAALLDKERTLVVPVVNVDGFISTHDDSAVDPNDTVGGNSTVELGESVAPPGGILAYRRKNCDGAIPTGSVPCELQYGVDNNRNYGNLWGGPGASQDFTSQSYHGPGPRSEPETQAVWNYVRTHQVTGLMTLHTIAALVLRPPGLHDGGLAPDEAAMRDLGDRMGAATGYTSQYSWQLYDTAGTTEDDTYAATGGYGYTIEIGPSGGLFHMPYATGVVKQWLQGDSQHGGGMREALLLMGESVADPAHHAVISGSAPAGAKLTLTRDFDTKTSPWCDGGVDPAVAVAALPDAVSCPGGVHEPLTLKDRLDSSTIVPASGTFEWHVNQSTRPFVGGGAIIRKLSDTPSRQQTFTGGGPDPANNTPGSSSQDREYTIGADEHPDVVKVDVTWDTPEDYDLEVYRKEADGKLTEVGTSGNGPGTPESVQLSGPQSTPGTYVVRVVNFAAAIGTWTAKVGLYSATETTTTGHREPYTLTCSVGGTVVQSRQVLIDRGQTLALNPCAGDAPPVVEGTPAAPAPAPAPAAAGGGVAGATHANPAAKPAPHKTTVTRAQVRAAARRCTAAKRVVHHRHGRARRRAAGKARKACIVAARLARAYKMSHAA